MNSQSPKGKAKAWLITLSGFIGAAGPSICQLIAMTQEGKWPHLNFYAGTILLGGLGSAIALIARETVPWKAFTHGLATPALFSSAGTVVVSMAFMGSMNFMSAYAQPPPPEEIETPDSVHVTVIAEDDITIVTGDRIYRAQKQTILKVPRNETIVIEDEDNDIYAVYNIKDENDNDSVSIKVRVQESKAKGHFLRGLLPMMNEQAQEKLSPKTLEIEETEK